MLCRPYCTFPNDYWGWAPFHMLISHHLPLLWWSWKTFSFKGLYETNKKAKMTFAVVQSLSHVWLFATPWTTYSMPGFPVLHHLPELTQTHIHWILDAIQPSHPLSFPSPPAFNLSQHQGLFQWASSSHQVAKVLEFQLQHQSFQRTPLGWTDRKSVV